MGSLFELADPAVTIVSKATDAIGKKILKGRRIVVLTAKKINRIKALRSEAGEAGAGKAFYETIEITIASQSDLPITLREVKLSIYGESSEGLHELTLKIPLIKDQLIPMQGISTLVVEPWGYLHGFQAAFRGDEENEDKFSSDTSGWLPKRNLAIKIEVEISDSRIKVKNKIPLYRYDPSVFSFFEENGSSANLESVILRDLRMVCSQSSGRFKDNPLPAIRHGEDSEELEDLAISIVKALRIDPRIADNFSIIGLMEILSKGTEGAHIEHLERHLSKEAPSELWGTATGQYLLLKIYNYIQWESLGKDRVHRDFVLGLRSELRSYGYTYVKTDDGKISFMPLELFQFIIESDEVERS